MRAHTHGRDKMTSWLGCSVLADLLPPSFDFSSCSPQMPKSIYVEMTMTTNYMTTELGHMPHCSHAFVNEVVIDSPRPMTWPN